MTHPVGQTDRSALQFERVWVREAVFVDLETEKAFTTVPPSAYQIKLEVRVNYAEDGLVSFVTLRAVLEAPPESRLMAKLSAAVEGAFSVSEGGLQRLQEFSKLQAPVLLLPYLRSAISNMTAESRLGAVVLPPLNMVSLVQEMANVHPQVTPARTRA